ncbi:MAG TPA: hypothetical protein VHH72_04185 [Solirubrobacterales bacterium]|nr:hypothetical protein [Solirubrobacterales bacterium]
MIESQRNQAHYQHHSSRRSRPRPLRVAATAGAMLICTTLLAALALAIV